MWQKLKCWWLGHRIVEHVENTQRIKSVDYENRYPTIFWGCCFPSRVIEFSDGTAELQRFNEEKREWEAIYIDDWFQVVSAHLHWLNACEGKTNGFRRVEKR